MSRTDIDDAESTAVSPALALAEQLRDGPLQELIDLQVRAHDLATEMKAAPGDHLRELAELVRLSLSAMEHFHRFTCDFQSLIRDLGDDAKPSH
jgi:hypothetical protein